MVFNKVLNVPDSVSNISKTCMKIKPVIYVFISKMVTMDTYSNQKYVLCKFQILWTNSG